jgi:hypothetical protein
MNDNKMIKTILTVFISLMFLLKLFAQTPGHNNTSNDSEYSGKNLYILPEYESWLVWWKNYNYLSDNTIKPGLFHSPSLSVKYGHYTYKLSFQVAENLASIITASTNAASFISLQASSDLVSSETKESGNFTFDSKVQFGRFKGKGTWSYYPDTINFQVVNETFDINSRSLFATFLVGIKGRKPCIGLKLINYNTPAYMVGKESIDPRDPNNTLLWAEIWDTKFTHLFLVVDPLALFYGKYFKAEPCTKKTQVKLQGHWYEMFGFGFAKNDTLGRVMTISFPFQANGSLNSMSSSFGTELDLGVRVTTRIGKHKFDHSTIIESVPNFRTAIGFRYTNWSIISFPKNELQLRSNEFYWGPYLNVALQF